MSHPSRVRGLKQSITVIIATFFAVAPFTGAWIETVAAVVRGGAAEVAPFTGAWIETLFWARQVAETVGRTLHGCVD